MAKRSGMYKMEKRKKELKRKKKKEEKMLNRIRANQERSSQDIEQPEQLMDAEHSTVDDSEDNDDE